MAKITFKCNHCGYEVKWYKKWIHETVMDVIDGKYYCEDCLKKLAHKGVDL